LLPAVIATGAAMEVNSAEGNSELIGAAAAAPTEGVTQWRRQACGLAGSFGHEKHGYKLFTAW
jgi:hypothetical protein